ncbi:hypothetical protein GCM10007108_07170 [Thermogymnomonas acidicola]|uniref:Uncharacterized protein n=1 Tax=Thermogymnomonas acidicola TaxID=399579 RepID=A0AA37F9T2_9ARCH|nr:hypothetical protein [Thermogymnomonas acidicola]GGM71625.1 hypothetical protein GCM10007108_07170 [Thermogymnomonas acidicola]
MLMIGDAMLFCEWVAGQIYRLAIGKKGRKRLKKIYNTMDSLGMLWRNTTWSWLQCRLSRSSYSR